MSREDQSGSPARETRPETETTRSGIYWIVVVYGIVCIVALYALTTAYRF